MQGAEWRRVEIVLHEKGVHVYKTEREMLGDRNKKRKEEEEDKGRKWKSGTQEKRRWSRKKGARRKSTDDWVECFIYLSFYFIYLLCRSRYNIQQRVLRRINFCLKFSTRLDNKKLPGASISYPAFLHSGISNGLRISTDGISSRLRISKDGIRWNEISTDLFNNIHTRMFNFPLFSYCFLNSIQVYIELAISIRTSTRHIYWRTLKNCTLSNTLHYNISN